MAELTANIGGINDHVRVIGDPAGNGGASALSMLAQGVDAFARDRQDIARRRSAEAQAARQARADEREELDRAAQSASVEALVSINNGSYASTTQRQGFQASDQGTGDPVFGANVMDPEGVQAAAQQAASQINMYNAAVSQGRLPGISRDAQVDIALQDLISRFPGRAHIIAQTLRENGVQNAMINETVEEANATRAQATAQVEVRTAAWKRGTELYDPSVLASMSEDQVVNAGMESIRAERAFNLVKEQAALEASRADANQKNVTFQQAQTARQMTQIGFEQGSAQLAPLVENWSRLMSMAGAAGSDPEREARLAEIIPMIRTQANVIVENLVARAGVQSPEAAQAIRSQYTDYFNRMFLQPMETRGEAQAAALRSVETYTGLRVAQAAPLIAGLSELGVNPQSIPTLFASLSTDQNLMQQLSSEVQGFTRLTPGSDLATIKLTNIVNALKGNITLQQMDPASAQAAVNASVGVVRTMAPQVAAGGGDVEMYQNGLGMAIQATQSINVNSGLDQLSAAALAVGSGTNAGAIRAMMRDPTQAEEARVLGQGSRAASAKILNEYQRAVPRTVLNFHRIVWDNRNARYTTSFDNEGFQAANRRRPIGAGGPAYASGLTAQGGAARATPPVPQQLRTMLDRMNGLVTYLQTTGDWDGDAPQGTPHEVRSYWGADRPTPAMQREAASPRANRDTEFRRAADAFTEQLLSTNIDVATPSAADYIEGPEGTGQNPRSSANGTGQFIRSTWLDIVRRNRPDLAEGKSDNEILALREDRTIGREMINAYARENGAKLAAAGLPVNPSTTYLAHFAGPEGAINLLRADPNAPVTSVLGQAAVNANPHLRGKTVGQTIQWASRFIGNNG